MYETTEHLVNFDEVNIEHLLPQKPRKKDWALNKEEIKEYVNTIGNLTILCKKLNSIAGNKPFKEKFIELQKSKLPINTDFINFIKRHDRWDKATIAERGKYLIDMTYDTIFTV